MYQLISGQNTEPVTIAELKAALRITSSDHDTLLGNLISAARAKAENYTKRYLKVGTDSDDYAVYKLYLDAFPTEDNREILIYKCPVASVDSIQYYDLDGNIQTLDSDEYDVDAVQEPARIKEAYGCSWPSTRERPNAVIVQFKCGYAKAANIPDSLKRAVLMIAAHLFENPSDIVTGTQVNEIPESSTWLLNDFTINQL